MLEQLEQLLSKLKGNLDKEEVGGVVSSGYHLSEHVSHNNTIAKLRVGEHIDTGEKVAVRIVRKSRLTDEIEIGNLMREVKIQASLDHFYTCFLFEVSLSQIRLYKTRDTFVL